MTSVVPSRIGRKLVRLAATKHAVALPAHTRLPVCTHSVHDVCTHGCLYKARNSLPAADQKRMATCCPASSCRQAHAHETFAGRDSTPSDRAALRAQVQTRFKRFPSARRCLRPSVVVRPANRASPALPLRNVPGSVSRKPRALPPRCVMRIRRCGPCYTMPMAPA
jgi:hypothetical protein